MGFRNRRDQGRAARPVATFLILWLGQLLSSVGSGMTGFALGVWWYQKTGSATIFSSLILASFLPGLLLRPFGGVLADRFDRRLLMLVADAFAASAIGALAALAVADALALGWIYLLLAAASLASALHNPAYKATVTDLVAPEDYQKSSGLVQLAQAAQYLVSPLLAGALLARTGLPLLLWIDAASFLLAAGTSLYVLTLRPGLPRPPGTPDAGGFRQELAQGFRVITGDAGLAMLVLLTTLICFLLGFVQALYGPMLLGLTDARTTGIVQSVSAAGLMIGAMVIGAGSRAMPELRMLRIALLVTGSSLMLLGLLPALWMIIGAGMLFFASLPFAQTALEVLMRRTIPNAVQGRAWAIISLLTQLGYPLAYAFAGPLADHVFIPAMAADGRLGGTLGALLGTGPVRGIGLLLALCGVAIVLLASGLERSARLKTLVGADPARQASPIAAQQS